MDQARSDDARKPRRRFTPCLCFAIATLERSLGHSNGNRRRNNHPWQEAVERKTHHQKEPTQHPLLDSPHPFSGPVHGVHVARRISLAGTRFRRNPHEPKILCRAACLFSTRKSHHHRHLRQRQHSHLADDRRRQNHHRPSRAALAQVRLAGAA